MARTRRPSKVAFVVGGVLVVLAVLWMAVGVPALVKYPTDVDVRPEYAGTFTLYVNPADASPLATPMAVPLTVKRHIQAIADESGAHRVTVRETIQQRAGDLVKADQTNQYVMDRRTLKNVKDAKAYAFTPSNVVDRSGTYRLNLPFGTSRNASYSIYKNEIGTTYTMKNGGSDVSREGLTLTPYTASVRDAPLTDAYVAELNKLVALPKSMTLEQLKPQLKTMGVDVDALMAALLPNLSAEDTATLAAIAAKPIPLRYTLSVDGNAQVERTTGAEVVVNSKESVGVQPQMADLATLTGILDRYPDVSAATAASAALKKLSTAPSIKLFQYEFAQTPASVKAIASEVKDQRRMVLLAQRWLPIGLALLAFVALVVGAFEWPRGARKAMGVPAASPKHA